MLQGLFSAMENNLAGSQLWSLANQAADPDHQAAAMEAILSQATLGLISEHQSLLNYGMIQHQASISEGMDETQLLPQSSCADHGDICCTSAAPVCSLGLDQKPLDACDKLSSEPSSMILGFPPDLSKVQAWMIAAAASASTKRRSWQEALDLSSPAQADHHNLNIPNPNLGDLSPPPPHILSSANDPKVSIASLAYPCTMVGKTHESDHYPSYIDHTGMGMATHIDPLINIRANHMQESMSSAGLCADHDHGTCMQGDTANKEMGGCAQWKEGMIRGHDQIKDVINTHEYMTMTHNGSPYEGIKSCHDDSGHLNLYKLQDSLHDDGKGKDGGIAWSSKMSIPLADDHHSRKRSAVVAHLPSSSTSYSKRAHLPMGAYSTTTTTTTTTTSTTTRSSKSSSRHPLGPALNTNGKPRAMQGSANDPQTLAARNRRERINARLKVLQELVPNGSKVDLVTMLEKAINYVKFLQLQLRVLSNDDYWQANQENVEPRTRSFEEGYSARLNTTCDSIITCTHNVGENQYDYICDKICKT